LGTLARSRQGTRLVERPVARFPLCALLAALSLFTLLASPRRRIVRRAVALLRAREAKPGAAHPPGPEVRALPARPGAPPAPSAAAAALAILFCLPGTAQGQSDWARGDAAFRKGDWALAETLYNRRARVPRPPAAVLANLAATRAQQQTSDSIETQLSEL